MKHQKIPLDTGRVRMMSTLALLPAETIESAFILLRRKYQDESNASLFNYYERFWIKKVFYFFSFDSF